MTAGVAGANDERMAHLMRAMNRLLDKHAQSRRRHLAWHTPAIVPVWPQVPHFVCRLSLKASKLWNGGQCTVSAMHSGAALLLRLGLVGA